MTESWKVRALREARENARPDQAAERAAGQFERAAIEVPEVLTPRDDARPWERRECQDAGELYRSLVMHGEAGMRLTDLGALIGNREHRAGALKRLRGAGIVSERREELPDNSGRMCEQIVLWVQSPKVS